MGRKITKADRLAGRELRRLREIHDLSRDALANRTGLKSHRIEGIEQEGSPMGVLELEVLLEVFGKTFDEFVATVRRLLGDEAGRAVDTDQRFDQAPKVMEVREAPSNAGGPWTSASALFVSRGARGRLRIDLDVLGREINRFEVGDRFEVGGYGERTFVAEIIAIPIDRP